MNHLWAPWRAQYILSSATVPERPSSACFLCDALAADRQHDRENLLVWRRPRSVVVLNRFPYNNGHLLVAPVGHAGCLADFQGPDLTEPVETLQIMVGVLSSLLRPDGFNVGLNQGKTAGAGLPGHLHWHIVPRWEGDTNFMPVLAGSKVIVESLDQFYDRLVTALADQLAADPHATHSPATA